MNMIISFLALAAVSMAAVGASNIRKLCSAYEPINKMIDVQKYLVDNEWKLVKSTKKDDTCIVFQYFTKRDGKPEMGTAFYVDVKNEIHQEKKSMASADGKSWECLHDGDATKNIKYYASYFETSDPTTFCLYSCSNMVVDLVRCFAKEGSEQKVMDMTESDQTGIYKDMFPVYENCKK